MIPMILKINIHEGGKKKIRLWIPMFLFWILFFVLMIVLLPIFILVGIIAWIRGYGKIFIFTIPMFFAVIWALSGLRIYVENEDKRIQFIAV
jgi:hypothetical protein